MTKMLNLYFSLGPVQAFVGKARRLRDYWTGSYLLSYLTEQAMDEVNKGGGKLIFPPYKSGENRKIESSLKIGSFPNRFQAEVPADFNPFCCEQSVIKTWNQIANYTWTEHMSKIAQSGKNTREIWKRQINSFWYIQWVLSDEEDDSLLDKRKNWRNYVPSIELGDKCTLLGNLQELSGYVRSSRKNEASKQRRFWNEVRKELPVLDLKEGETLSAVALIKRVFPRVYNDFEQTNFPENFPSTTYMSAIPWIGKVITNKKGLAVDFANEAQALKGAKSESKAGIQPLEKLVEKDNKLRDFASLDGNFFYSHTLLNDNLWETNTTEIRERLEKRLKIINREVFEADTYYALLSTDGDSIGAILQKYTDKKVEISKAISEFSKSVPQIIRNNGGRVAYAGGEDVFAILPVNTAINAASKLKKKYEGLFEPVFNSKDIATISAAIIFVHHHAPLTQVYSRVQSILDNVAKEEYGRSSLVIGTWNTGGPDLIWAMPWQRFIDTKTGHNLLKNLAMNLGYSKGNEKDVGQTISHSFIYNLRKELSLFVKENSLFSEEDFLDLITAEYIKSKLGVGENLTPERVRPLMKKLLAVCSKYYRNKNGEIEKQKGFNFDGALLVKFLAKRWAYDNEDLGI